MQIPEMLLGLGMQIPEHLTQRKIVSAMCHCSASLFQQGATTPQTAQNGGSYNSYAHKPPKTMAPFLTPTNRPKLWKPPKTTTSQYWPAYRDSELGCRWRGKDSEASVGREGSL